MSEPIIVINGYTLSESQAMIVRVALETLALTLATDGLGTDQTGKAICAGYEARLNEIRRIIFERKACSAQS